MRALSGCTRCGHVERSYREAGGQPGKECPECGFPLKDVDLLAARVLARESRRARAPRVQRQERLVERALKTNRRLRRTEDAPRAI
jgi:hypothetical protein